MNKIDFPRKDVDGKEWSRKDVEKWFCNAFYETVYEKLREINAQDYSREEQKILRFIIEYLESILLASPKRLELITKVMDNINISSNFRKKIMSVFNYTHHRKNKLIDLAKILNIKSCPYCNMHYTLYAEKKKRKKYDKLAKFQFDHFFDKSTYPMLSMSLYNLIPSCSICNNSKSTARLSLSYNPYYSDISKRFKFKLKDPISLYEGQRITDIIDIDIVATDSSRKNELDDYIRTFNLNTLYQRHGDLAQEIFDKAYEYPYYSNSDNFQFLNGCSPEYLKRLWMGTYIDEEDIHKRPMTKFMQDLWEQAIGHKKELIKLS